MTRPNKDQQSTKPESKKSSSTKTEINKGKAELSDDELKKVSGGASTKKPREGGW